MTKIQYKRTIRPNLMLHFFTFSIKGGFIMKKRKFCCVNLVVTIRVIQILYRNMNIWINRIKIRNQSINCSGISPISNRISPQRYLDEASGTWTTENFQKAVQAVYDYGHTNVGVVYCSGQGGDQGTQSPNTATKLWLAIL